MHEKRAVRARHKLCQRSGKDAFRGHTKIYINHGHMSPPNWRSSGPYNYYIYIIFIGTSLHS